MPVQAKKKASQNDELDELVVPLYEVLNDDADSCDLEWDMEFGDPGTMGRCFIEIAQKARVSLMYTVRAALYCFWEEHQDDFIADPQNLKYRNPTREEERAMRNVSLKRLDFYIEEMKQGRCPAVYPYEAEEKSEQEKALRKVRLQVAPKNR